VTPADRITAALLLALAVAFSAGALKFYPYSSEGGPGSGFLPFWLGVVMAALALLMLLRQPRTTGLEWLPDRKGATRVVAVIAATIAFVAVLNVVGMVVGTALYLAALIRFLGRHRWWVALAVAAGAAGFNYLVFARWLRVPFPEGMLWIF
jgi:Tripartite tricarboxylate transporter TctB family